MILRCPRCGFRFDVSYARAYACIGCPVLATRPTCDYVKCPRCGYEFPISRQVPGLAL